MVFAEQFIEIIILISLSIISAAVILLLILLIKDYVKKQVW